MVKNTHGGNKSKSMARKNLVSSHESSLRLPASPHEQIAVVHKLLGNGMFYAMTQDNNILLARIRNKFKGRSRRDNDIALGKLVLIGLREWASSKDECDLLFVYDPNDYSRLPFLSPELDNSPFLFVNNNDLDNDLDNHHDPLVSDLLQHTPILSDNNNINFDDI
jgi:translation initiation factor IF-1